MTKTRFLPLAVFLLVLAVYLAFPTKLYYWDGVAYSLEIENPGKFRPTLTHPNHLLFGPAGYYVHQSLKLVWPGVRSVEALQITSSVFGAGAVALVCSILLALGASAYLAALLSLLMAFSATWWKFSTDASAYVPSVFFLVLCAWLLVGARRPSALLLALAHTAAMLFHQLAVLFLPAAIVGLVVARQRAVSVRGASDQKLVARASGRAVSSERTFVQGEGALADRFAVWPLAPRSDAAHSTQHAALSALTYFAVAVPLTLACYYYGFWLNEHTLDPRRFPAWISFHTPDSHFTFNLISDAGKTLLSHLRLFFGGKLSALAVWGLAGRAVVLALLVALVAALLWKLVRYRGELRPALRPSGELKFAATWAAVYFAFLFVWLPQNTFYRLFYLPALVLLAGVVLARQECDKPVRRYRLALAVAVVVLFNFVFFIYPNSLVSANPPLAFALEMKREWQPGTVVYYATLATDDWILMYENPQTRWIPIAAREAAAPQSLITAPAPAAWLETTAVDLISSTPGGSQWLAAHTGSRRELVTSRQRIRLAKLTP